MDKKYDLIIVGAGPAGLSAAIYAARYSLKCVVIGEASGNSAAKAPFIDNYPGFTAISGAELISKFQEQVGALGVEIRDEQIKEVKNEKGLFRVRTDVSEYTTKTIIIATGTKRKKLNVPGETEFLGKGIVYCVTCDGPLFADKDVAIIGGGDSAVSAAQFMLSYAKRIYMIDIAKAPMAKPASIEALKKEKKVEFLSSCKVTKIVGNKLVNAIGIENIETKTKKEIKVEGVIIEIGMLPSTELARQLKVSLNKEGFIIADREMKTNVQGIFAAGDIIEKSLRQIITAASDGAIAAHSAYEYLKLKE
jgi:thioredoxin reductase (NADPH)